MGQLISDASGESGQAAVAVVGEGGLLGRYGKIYLERAIEIPLDFL